MKIAPVLYSPKKNTLPVKSAQSVSFKSSSNFLTRGFEELNSDFNEKIVPFMNDSRTLYIETGKIGYNAQQIADFVTFKENQLFQYKLRIPDAAKEKLLPEVRSYLEAVQEYERNKRTFENIERMANLPVYDKNELKTKIAAAKMNEFCENNELSEKNPVIGHFKNLENDFEHELNSINLKNSGKIYEKFAETKDTMLSAQYFMLITPYNDAMKLKLLKDEFAKILKSRPINFYTGEDRLNSMQKSADKIIHQKEFFYKNREDMKNFVKANRSRKMPSIQEFDDVYKNSKQKCNKIAADYVKNTNDFYLKNAENINFDPEKAQKLLNAQKAVNDELLNIIDAIKTEYITECNKDFYNS